MRIVNIFVILSLVNTMPVFAQKVPTQYTPGSKITVKTIIPEKQYEPYFLENKGSKRTGDTYQHKTLDRDTEKSIDELRKDCIREKDGESCYQMGMLLVGKTSERAMQPFRLGCKFKHEQSCKEYEKLIVRSRHSQVFPRQDLTPRSAVMERMIEGQVYEDQGMDEIEEWGDEIRENAAKGEASVSDEETEAFIEFMKHERVSRGIVKLKNEENICGIIFPPGTELRLNYDKKVESVTTRSEVRVKNMDVPPDTLLHFDPKTGKLESLTPKQEGLTVQGVPLIPYEKVEFHINGAIKRVFTKEAKRIGGKTFRPREVLYFDSNGRLKLEGGRDDKENNSSNAGYELNGSEERIFTEVNEKGIPISQQGYGKSGTKTYFPDGAIQMETYLDPDSGIRETRVYYNNGDLRTRILYQDGEIIEEEEYDEKGYLIRPNDPL